MNGFTGLDNEQLTAHGFRPRVSELAREFADHMTPDEIGALADKLEPFASVPGPAPTVAELVAALRDTAEVRGVYDPNTYADTGEPILFGPERRFTINGVLVYLPLFDVQQFLNDLPDDYTERPTAEALAGLSVNASRTFPGNSGPDLVVTRLEDGPVQITLTAAGYEFTCPRCRAGNHLSTVADDVMCRRCGFQASTESIEHVR